MSRNERHLSMQSTASTDTITRAFNKFSNVPKTVKEYCPRIRILVMGKRNAGKTTLLQRMTRSSDGQFLLRTEDGKLIDDPGSILAPALEASPLRGHSHIDYEITYPSDKDYIFHDSRGMEAGSDDEFRVLKEFIKEKQEMKYLGQRLHVIWLCLPVDNDRPLGELEMAFFEHATAGVPVIAIFTKFEWRITKAYDQLRDDGKNIVQSRREAPAKALIDFGEIQNQRFANVPNPPAAYVFLQEMNTDSGSSEQLTQITRQLVENKVNQQLFSEIKHNSIKITMAISLVQYEIP
ncbi:hypothetical protein D9757_011800 [Collybiopsis confluens]|uniref:G domain-containing protein n=1 Tax=Collybiopsis confluens TaxID=2823264 RepID=A0A8H5LPE0_9AGAR|nr:hypothetical protein D9757_011800 [Collybiopsis confluens]